MVAPRIPLGKAEVGDSTPPRTDPRLAAFARLCVAIDFSDPGRARDATRDLRALGFSVVIVTPKGRGGVA